MQLENLPPEINLNIIEFLPPESIKNLCQTNSKFVYLCNDSKWIRQANINFGFPINAFPTLRSNSYIIHHYGNNLTNLELYLIIRDDMIPTIESIYQLDRLSTQWNFALDDVVPDISYLTLNGARYPPLSKKEAENYIFHYDIYLNQPFIKYNKLILETKPGSIISKNFLLTNSNGPISYFQILSGILQLFPNNAELDTAFVRSNVFAGFNQEGIPKLAIDIDWFEL